VGRSRGQWMGADVAGFRGIGQVPQCLYCLRKTLKIDPTDVGTLFELASIYRADKQAGKVSL